VSHARRPPVPPVTLRSARLTELLRSPKEDRARFAFPTKEAVQEARALGPEAAAEAVADLLTSYEPGGDHAPAARAVGLVHTLSLERAIPALVACIERLPEEDPVGQVSAASLNLLGPERIAPLLEAFARTADPVVRWRLGISLCFAPKGTGGVRDALEELLEAEPADAGVLLAQHGDREALPALQATLDRLDFPSSADLDELPAIESVLEVGRAILELGGKLGSGQREKVERANARYGALIESGLLPVDPPPGACSRN
jgi:hypothetical protein